MFSTPNPMVQAAYYNPMYSNPMFSNTMYTDPMLSSSLSTSPWYSSSPSPYSNPWFSSSMYPTQAYSAQVCPTTAYTAPICPTAAYTAPICPTTSYTAPICPTEAYTAPVCPIPAYQPQFSANMYQTQALPSSEDLTQLAWQIAQSYQLVQCRAPQVYRQYIPIAGPPGRLYQAVRQLPAPSPDVIQRLYVVQPGRDMVDLLIQSSPTPCPVYQDSTICQPGQPPIVTPRIFSQAQASSYVCPMQPCTTQFMPTAAPEMPVAPVCYNYAALPPYIANTTPYPVAYGTRAFPREYPRRMGSRYRY